MRDVYKFFPGEGVKGEGLSSDGKLQQVNRELSSAKWEREKTSVDM